MVVESRKRRWMQVVAVEVDGGSGWYEEGIAFGCERRAFTYHIRVPVRIEKLHRWIIEL